MSFLVRLFFLLIHLWNAVDMEFPDKFKEMMENESDDDGLGLIHEAFICCVCRDLLYKPVVLACGHVLCFWCIHKSMSGLHKSRCPICRNQYYHFPSICQMLHLILLKLYPDAYEQRENQILEDEKSIGYFSPQFNVPAHQLQPKQTVIRPIATLQPCISQTGSSINGCSIRTEETPGKIEEVETVSVNLKSMPDLHVHREDNVTDSVSAVKNKNSNPLCSNDGTWKNVSANDVSCGSCKRVLFRPIVLNCGHVFCICCIVLRTNEMLKCEVCQSPHPGNIPKVCLEFDHFLEEHFPEEYGLRIGVQQKQEKSVCETPGGSSEGDKERIPFQSSSGKDPLPWWDANSKVHIGVGCDSCGMYPIIGDRYKCKDCVEEVGYDLCKDCYSTRSKLPGRFNQQHTLDHKFEIVKSNAMHDMMLRLLRDQLQVVSAFSEGLDYSLEDSANTIPSLSDNTDEDAGNDPLLTSSDADEDQNHSQ